MVEKNLGQIPTLQDVVELGAGLEEENIRITADSSLDADIDDAYDDEFKQLFDSTLDDDTDAIAGTLSDQPAHNEADSNAVLTTEPNKAAHEAGDVTSVDIGEAIVASSIDDLQEEELAVVDVDDNAALNISANNAPISLDTTSADDGNLWIEDWQEEVANDENIETTALSDSETDSMIEQAVTTDSREDASLLQAETTSPASTDTRATANTHIDTDALTDQLVTELMPEIEWKLRNKIRDVLEQQFPPED